MSHKSIRLGIKTFTIFWLTLLSFILALQQGRLQLEYLINLSTTASLFLGIFTFLIGMGLIIFMDLKNPSHSYLIISKKRRSFANETPLLEIFNTAIYVGKNSANKLDDFPYKARAGLAFFISFFIGTLFFNTHTSSLLVEAPHKLFNGGLYCADAEKHEDEKVNKQTPGCELIERAIELGLASNQSSCQVNQEENKLELCKLRQRDEPLLHYSVRRVGEFIQDIGISWQHFAFWKKVENSFLERASHGKTLFKRLARVMKGEPKAAHHIFTNLPQPHKASDRENCLYQYRRLSPIMKINPNEPDARSLTLDHIYGQMLFDPQFDDSAGFCKEYVIHWNSPLDSCEQLARQPEVFLKSQGIIKNIKNTINREAEHFDLQKMKIKLRYIALGYQELPPPALAPTGITDKKPRAYPIDQTIISFQCLMEEDPLNKSTFKEVPFKFDNQKFVAREVRFPKAPEGQQIYTEMYKYFAQAMVGDNFNFENSKTHEAKDAVNQWHIGPQFFSEGEYPLTRLEFLKQTDVFFGNSWIQNRKDLLEVYPYYHHLNYFINLFRDEYRSQRTRL